MLSTLEKILFLRQAEIFSDFSARELGILAPKAREVCFSKDQVIFREGDIGDALYVIIGGKVRVVRERSNTKEVLAILEEKTCFGEMAILSEEMRTATIESADSTTLLKIKKDDFRELILQKPEIVFPIFNILIKRAKNATDLLMSVKNQLQKET